MLFFSFLEEERPDLLNFESTGDNMLREKRGPKPKRKVGPVLGAVGLSLLLAGGASAAGAQVADALTHNAVVSHEITLGEEELADVSLATFYVFDKENAGPSRHSERLACGCWTGTYYTSGNDAYQPPLRPVTQMMLPCWRKSAARHRRGVRRR